MSRCRLLRLTVVVVAAITTVATAACGAKDDDDQTGGARRFVCGQAPHLSGLSGEAGGYRLSVLEAHSNADRQPTVVVGISATRSGLATGGSYAILYVHQGVLAAAGPFNPAADARPEGFAGTRELNFAAGQTLQDDITSVPVHVCAGNEWARLSTVAHEVEVVVLTATPYQLPRPSPDYNATRDLLARARLSR